MEAVNLALRLRYQLDDVRCFPGSSGFNRDMWNSSDTSYEYIPITLRLVFGSMHFYENRDINKIPIKYLFPHSVGKQILVLGDAGVGKSVCL